jgi:hypothetical protein
MMRMPSKFKLIFGIQKLRRRALKLLRNAVCPTGPHVIQEQVEEEEVCHRY